MPPRSPSCRIAGNRRTTSPRLRRRAPTQPRRPAPPPPRPCRRHLADDLTAAQESRAAESLPAGEEVVHLQAHPVVWRLPPAVCGDDERVYADEVRRVPQQPAALAQRLGHKPEVAPCEIA